MISYKIMASSPATTLSPRFAASPVSSLGSPRGARFSIHDDVVGISNPLLAGKHADLEMSRAFSVAEQAMAPSRLREPSSAFGCGDVGRIFLGMIFFATIVLWPLGFWIASAKPKRVLTDRYNEMAAFTRFIQDYPSLDAYQKYRDFVMRNKDTYLNVRQFKSPEAVTNSPYARFFPGVLFGAQNFIVFGSQVGEMSLLEGAVASALKQETVSIGEYFKPGCCAPTYFAVDWAKDAFPIVMLFSLPVGKLTGAYDINNRFNGFNFLHILAMMPETPMSRLAIQALLFEGADPELPVGTSDKESYTRIIQTIRDSEGNTYEMKNEYELRMGVPVGKLKLAGTQLDFNGKTPSVIAEEFGFENHAALIRAGKTGVLATSLPTLS